MFSLWIDILVNLKLVSHFICNVLNIQLLQYDVSDVFDHVLFKQTDGTSNRVHVSSTREDEIRLKRGGIAEYAPAITVANNIEDLMEERLNLLRRSLKVEVCMGGSN